MVRMIQGVLRTIDRHMQGIETHEWAIIAIALVVLGFFCMRGFGNSRL